MPARLHVPAWPIPAAHRSLCSLLNIVAACPPVHLPACSVLLPGLPGAALHQARQALMSWRRPGRPPPGPGTPTLRQPWLPSSPSPSAASVLRQSISCQIYSEGRLPAQPTVIAPLPPFMRAPGTAAYKPTTPVGCCTACTTTMAAWTALYCAAGTRQLFQLPFCVPLCIARLMWGSPTNLQTIACASATLCYTALHCTHFILRSPPSACAADARHCCHPALKL